MFVNEFFICNSKFTEQSRPAGWVVGGGTEGDDEWGRHRDSTIEAGSGIPITHRPRSRSCYRSAAARVSL